MATVTEAKKNYMGAAKGFRGSIFRHASTVEKKLLKVRTASTERSIMSERSRSIQTDQFSDRKIIHPETPDVTLSAVASTCNSTFQKSSDTPSLLNQNRKVQENELQTPQPGEPNIATSCERIQIDKREKVMNFIGAPSTPPRLQIANQNPPSNKGKLGVSTELQHSVYRRDLSQEVGQDIESHLECTLAKPSVETPASTSDQSEKIGERSAEKAAISVSTSTSSNQPASPSTHSLSFDFDLLGNSCGMKGHSTSRITTPVGNAFNCCNDAAKSLASDCSDGLLVRTAVFNGPDSPSIQSSCEADFSN